MGDEKVLYTLWHVARQGEHETHRLVPGVGSGVEHTRATAIDHLDAVLLSFVKVEDAPSRVAAWQPLPGGNTLRPRPEQVTLGGLAWSKTTFQIIWLDEVSLETALE